MLSGYAWDPEDGPLPDASLTWESDRDGFLGDGDELVVTTLSSGRHVITMTATDSDGQADQVSVSIAVQGGVYLPLVLHNRP